MPTTHSLAGGAVSVIAPQVDEETRASRAHRASIKKFSAAVDSLVQLIGAQLTAYIGEVKETRAVRKWIEGDRAPHPFIQSKIGLALQAAQILQEAGEGPVIDAWFQGLNPALGDRSPAELIHDAKKVDFSRVGREILAAAREFVGA